MIGFEELGKSDVAKAKEFLKVFQKKNPEAIPVAIYWAKETSFTAYDKDVCSDVVVRTVVEKTSGEPEIVSDYTDPVFSGLVGKAEATEITHYLRLEYMENDMASYLHVVGSDEYF